MTPEVNHSSKKQRQQNVQWVYSSGAKQQRNPLGAVPKFLTMHHFLLELIKSK
jgi:hypothetical protein